MCVLFQLVYRGCVRSLICSVVLSFAIILICDCVLAALSLSQLCVSSLMRLWFICKCGISWPYSLCLLFCFLMLFSTRRRLSNSYTMGCPPVRGDNPRALASRLSYVQVDKHAITISYHQHQCRPCTSRYISC